MTHQASPSPDFPPPKPPKSKLPLVFGLLAGALTLLCAVGAVASVWLWGAKQRESRAAETTASQEQPTTTAAASPDPVLATVGRPDAAVVLDVYEDFMCPACGAFEEAYGEQVAKAVGEGKLRVRFHMLNFLNRSSASKDYSSRAAGAALAVFQKAPDKFLAFHSKLFSQDTQPQEGSESDLSNDQLAQLAEGVGAGAAAADIRSGADVQAAVGAASAATNELSGLLHGRVFTPAVLKDGKPVDWAHDQQWLEHLSGS
ncbi:MAG: thioredoxin domain-containing protein [Segniliparus sp.]|uniref:thioredoxin domain-containing protein n=1 Tax=Segniliparus sp. TaxID=2804064 RepID=UPI003F2E7E91